MDTGEKLTELDPKNRHHVIGSLEKMQSEIEDIALYLTPFREGRRSVALAITKLDEARLWLGEAIVTEGEANK